MPCTSGSHEAMYSSIVVNVFAITLFLSDHRQWDKRCWCAHDDRITALNPATFFHNAHDACATHNGAIISACNNRLQQTWLEVVDLCTGIAESGHSNHRRSADAKQRPGGQVKKPDAPRRDILAQLTCCDIEPTSAEFVEELGVE